ncbi:hypothetical protein MOK15_21135 [Sphingobium sp. BYY-5]|nr:hypothetical protein [Sphingobium sp. BYY-5]MCI4592564.1 hypothetical protein [Sphingobium sp. BYY-5]
MSASSTCCGSSKRVAAEPIADETTRLDRGVDLWKQANGTIGIPAL